MMGNGGLGLELGLRERSKVRIREIKGRLEERERDFWTLRDPAEKEERKKTRDKGERGKILAKNHLLKRKKGDLAFQRAHTLKSSLRVKLEA